MGENKIYIMDTGALQDKHMFESLYETVSQDRKNKIDKYRREKNKILSLAAELLLKKALADCGIDSFHVEYGKNGKPFLKGESIFFNLSHTAERVMCAVSDREVGCDTEKITDINLDIAARFFHPSECAMLKSLRNPDAKRMLFFRLWTLKESFIKALGTGMRLPLSSFSIEIAGDAVSVRQEISKEMFYFKEYDLSDGYRYAVCSSERRFADTINVIQPENL